MARMNVGFALSVGELCDRYVSDFIEVSLKSDLQHFHWTTLAALLDGSSYFYKVCIVEMLGMQ